MWMRDANGVGRVIGTGAENDTENVIIILESTSQQVPYD